MADFPGLPGLPSTQTNSLSASPDMPQTTPGLAMPGMPPPDPFSNDAQLLDLFDRLRRESADYRWIWEREWLRDLYYVANRQWIMYHSTRREWVDKRMQKWVPRPVTNKMGEILQSIRTTFGAVQLAITARPIGNDVQSIAASQVADQMFPLIHEEHLMNQVMREADFWLIVTGNACLQVSWDKDTRFNRIFVPHEKCLSCGQVFPPDAIVQAQQKCPSCGSSLFQRAEDASGKPIGNWTSFGRGKTTALSPFEYMMPPNITRFDELPYIIRIRWRDKHWFEANKPELVSKITWEKAPSERSMQIFKSLALTNDVGTGAQLATYGSAASNTVEGVTEYELWLKPTPDFPNGLVMRVIGDKSPVVLRIPEEGLPGPFPFIDIEGNPLFPFMHAQYEHMGGRLYGRSALSPLIQKQDQLNQLDSLIQLCVQRTSNPVWVIPEGAGIDHFSGEPGLIMKWNPLAAGGMGKPERIGGVEIPSSLYAYRAQILDDLNDLSGAYDILRGQKPAGVEAFSALQLMVERSQSRFGSVFASRGEMYRQWGAIAIELERQFGPQQRTMAVVGPNKGYTFRHFENAQLQASMTFQIEDGSSMPKTALGKRAAIEQANQLQLLNPQDPDQKFALLSQFGLTDLVPTLNFHTQSALQIQDAFEKWAASPVGPSPLQIKPWHDPHVHYVERIKWLNTDRMRELVEANPPLEGILDAHLQQLTLLMNPQGIGLPPAGAIPPGQPLPPSMSRPMPPGAKPGPHGGPSGAHAPGGGQAMTASNRESGAIDTLPSGNNMTGSQNQGPR